MAYLVELFHGGEAAFDKSAQRFYCSARDDGDHSLFGAVPFPFFRGIVDSDSFFSKRSSGTKR
jgi:hypothetical protein